MGQASLPGILGGRGIGVAGPSQGPGLGHRLLQAEGEDGLAQVVEQGGQFRRGEAHGPQEFHFPEDRLGCAVRQDLAAVKEYDPGAKAGQAQIFSQEDEGQVPGPAE